VLHPGRPGGLVRGQVVVLELQLGGADDVEEEVVELLVHLQAAGHVKTDVGHWVHLTRASHQCNFGLRSGLCAEASCVLCAANQQKAFPRIAIFVAHSAPGKNMVI